MPEGITCNFEYHAPKDEQELAELLEKYGAAGRLIAGGTDVIPKLKAGSLQFEHLISLKDVGELAHIHFTETDGLRIGAAATLREIERFPVVREKYPALWQGIVSMANTQVRNRGTVVGNICNAVPSADTAPALLAYDAVIKLVSVKGTRSVRINEFFTGVCKTVLKPNEYVAEIDIPVPERKASSIYFKYTIRNALDLAMVGVASYTVIDNGIVRDIKLALGAVAATPKRAENAEKLLSGKQLNEELIQEAARIASEDDCTPITDIRATAGYRREMVRLHVRDALNFAANSQQRRQS